MKRLSAWAFLFFLCYSSIAATTYCGRVMNATGECIPYATIYLENNPMVGTATNNQGYFQLQTTADSTSILIVSFIGYAKQELPLSTFANQELPYTIVLEEQPIALEETVVSAKASKQKNKRKAMAQLLYQVYNRLLYDLPNRPIRYHIVSDVSLDTEGEAWGMEQMIATAVHLLETSHEGYDSIQFAGEHCKRFLNKDIRERANAVLEGNKINNQTRNMAIEMDSGTLVHRSLWASRQIRKQFENTMNDIKHWTITHENEGETILTHTERHNFLGLFKAEIISHYIVHSDTYSLLRFSEESHAQLIIPFGYKLKADDLELLNLLNIEDQAIKKFRLRKVQASVRMNTIFQRDNGITVVKERNLQAKALLTGTKNAEIPLSIHATQHVAKVSTENVQPLNSKQIKNRVKREIVPVY